MKTQTIAGHSITLEAGKRYIATRPFAKRGDINRQRFTITDFANVHSYYGPVLVTIPNLTYDQANEFLAQFNNEECSLSGRVW